MIKKSIMLYNYLFSIWIKIPEKVRFLLVGGYNTVISYAIYSLILYILNGHHPQFSLFCAFILSSVNSFWTQKIFVFQSVQKAFPEYIRCLGAWSINYGFNAVLLFIFADVCHINPYAAQFLALVLVTVNSYMMLKYIAFKKKEERK